MRGSNLDSPPNDGAINLTHAGLQRHRVCLMPGFLKLFTEQQDRIPLLHLVVQQAAFDLYFKESSIGLPTPAFVIDPELDLNADFPTMVANLL
jgi:hypothetical protein